MFRARPREVPESEISYLMKPLMRTLEDCLKRIELIFALRYELFFHDIKCHGSYDFSASFLNKHFNVVIFIRKETTRFNLIL